MKIRSLISMNKLTLSALAALALTAMPAQAADRYWNGVEASPDAGGGNGTWNTALTNWQTAPTGGSSTAWVNGNNDTAFFGNTVGTVSLGTGITVGGLQFDTAGYVVQSNTLTFGVSGNIVTNADATINSALAATSGLTITKTGSGTLTLGGSNTYAGNTTISAGTLKAGNTTALSTNSVFSVAAPAILDLGGFSNTINSLSTATGTITNSTGSATLKFASTGATAQLFTGSLGLQVSGSQNTDFTNASNTYSGGTLIGFNNGINNRVLLSGRTLGVGTPGALTSGQFGTGAITLGVSATDRAQIYMVGTNTINNAIVVNSALGNIDNAGAFQIRSVGNTINGAINANLAPVTFQTASGTGGINLTGAISGNSGLTLLASTGTALGVTLTNTGTANSYAGDTTISSVKETLTLGAANQLPNGAGKGNLIVTGGNFNMGGFSETINGLSGNGTVDGVSGTPTLTVGDNDQTSTFSGVIKNNAGTLALTKIGTGNLTLSGNNSYSGNTTVSAGILKAGSTTGLSANSAFSAATGATLDLAGNNSIIKGFSSASANGTITNSSGSLTTLRALTAMGASSTAGTSAQLFTGNMSLQIFGGGGADTLLLNGNNTYSGGTILGNGSGATTTRILLGGGTLGAGTPGAVTSGLFGTGAITIGAATTDRSQLYFSGALTINNAIVVNSAQGDGAQFGAFRHEAPGSSVVIAGTVNANLADVMVFSSNGNSTRTLSFTNTISGNSGLQVQTQLAALLNVTLNNAGTANSYAGNTTIGTANSSLTLGRADQISNGVGKGNLIITGGTFNMGGFSETINGLSGNGTVDGISGTPTLTVGDGNATSTFSGVIKNTAGALALTKTGNGTLTLSNTNTYSGATLVSTGTLLVNGSTSASSAVNVSSGAILGGNGMVGGSLTVASGATLSPGNSPGILSSGNLSLSGILSMEINGVTVGTLYDQVNVTGTVSLVSGNTLTLSLGYTPTDGTNFFLINNDLSDAIVGTLNGFAQDAIFTLASQLWKISYTGDSGTNSFSGSGNDLVIQAIPEPATWALLAFSLTTVMVLRRRRKA